MASKREHDLSRTYGSEPTVSHLDPISVNYNADLMRINNWYSAEKTRADSYKYYEYYIKHNRPEDAKYFSEIEEKDVHITYGWIARLVLQGAKLSPTHMQGFNNALDELIRLGKHRFYNKKSVAKVITPIGAVKKTSIQDAMKEKTSEYIGEVEGLIDDFIKNDVEINLYNNLKSNQIPGPYVSDIKEWAQKKLDQYNAVVETKDSQTIEGYANINKRKLKNLVKLFEAFIADCEKYSQFKKANRKPRAVREKPAVAQIKALKYKVKDEELGLTSAKAIDLVGAEQVWLFNTKTRKLAVYTSESTKGMTVKGSALQNWSPDKSKQKTLRKPAEQIKDLMGAGKVKLRTYINDIKAKEQAVNGRINIDTIILRIMR